LLLLLLLSPALAAQKVMVETATVQERPVSIELERPGTLLHRRLFRVYNQEEGRIEKLPWYEGDRVDKGALLMQLDTSLLSSEKRKAEADLHLKQRRLSRLEKLLKENAASTDEVAEARTELEVARAELQILQTRLRHTRVLAPFAGLVVERLAEPGDVKPRNSHLLTLADPASLVVRFRLDADLLERLSPGQQIGVQLASQTYPARISRIFPLVDRRSRLGKVEARFVQPPADARAGQFVRILLRTQPRPRILIPFPALRVDRRGEHVYLVEQDRARRQPVKSGRRYGSKVAILEGLKPGQTVIVRGFMGLKNGASVTVSHGKEQRPAPAP
jgi:RND family efflux transporter MFP subunit